MSIEDAFELINNLDVPEGLRRKFAPQHSLIHINRDGEIASVVRFKHYPSEAEQLDALNNAPRCVQIIGVPGMYASLPEFRSRIADSMFLFDHMKR